MNFLDRAIGFVAPQRAAKRARARLQVEAMTTAKRSYDAAKLGRRTSGWIAGGGSANAETVNVLPILRYRSRELVRNNPYAARAIDILAANTVGTGIRPEAIDPRALALWERWAETTECDAEGQLDFYGIQRLVARTVEESGECLIRLRTRRPEDKLSVPLQLQVMEPDFLDASKDTSSLANGGTIEGGIEFDAIGRRAAYWLYKAHPGELTLRQVESVRVDARDVLHVYDKKRPGQNRGVPKLATVAMKLKDLDDYQEAALIRAKIEACMAAFVTKQDSGDINPLAPVSETVAGERIEAFEPGMIEYLNPGESIEFANPTASGGFEPYTLHTLMAIAAGIGITYDQLTGDLRQANYSSLRAGKVEFRRLVEQQQWQIFVPMLCAPIWRRFIADAVLAGALRPGLYPAEWSPPRHEPIDPKKDLDADITAIRAGLMTWRQGVARMGFDPSRQLQEIAEINAEADALGVVLDTDPRRMSAGGQAQATENTPDE
jgi:lambda family phage portal protein